MNRETLLARRQKRTTSDVALSDGAMVKIRKLSQAEFEHARRHYAGSDPGKQIAGLRYVVCVCALNDDNTQMFNDADMDELAGLDFDDINTIAAAIGVFSGTHADPKASPR